MKALEARETEELQQIRIAGQLHEKQISTTAAAAADQLPDCTSTFTSIYTVNRGAEDEEQRMRGVRGCK